MPYTPMELAAAFIKTGELNDALDALNQQITTEPDDVVARRLRAQVLLRLAQPGQLEQALTDLGHLPNPDADDYIQQSLIHEKLHNINRALQAIQRALKLSPEDERMIERQLNLLVANDDLTGALQLVQEQSRTWRWLQWEADLLVQLGDDEHAAQRYGAALSQMDGRHFLENDAHLAAIRARMLLARGHTLRRLGHYTEADQHYQMAAESIPDDPVIDFNRGLLLALQDKLDEAVTQCKQALDRANPILKKEMLNALQTEELQPLSDRLSA